MSEARPDHLERKLESLDAVVAVRHEDVVVIEVNDLDWAAPLSPGLCLGIRVAEAHDHGSDGAVGGAGLELALGVRCYPRLTSTIVRSRRRLSATVSTLIWSAE
jgi:hypothetical protein